MWSLTSAREEKRAVTYYRHSAEDKQENSVPIQRRLVEEYARQRGITIIHEEKDEGYSGLTADRPGFQRLLNEWVRNPKAPSFDTILVRDVSRWGRFQNTDEAAFYRFLCRRYGKRVKYVEHGDRMEENNLITHLLTSVEQFMAAEYSRQLSEKVFHGCVEVSRQGFSAGGTACYGLERLLLDVHKQPVRVLQRGEHKAIANERVTFRPRNDESTKAVREIFELCVLRWKTPEEIATCLNERRIVSSTGRSWSTGSVTRVLTNPAYVGTRVYNKTWSRLREKRRRNPPSTWVVTPNAFPATVDEETFAEAQRRLYWIRPSRWRGGLRAVQRARRAVEAEVMRILERRHIPRNMARVLARVFPLTICVAQRNSEGKGRWCFTLPGAAWKHPAIVAIGVQHAPDGPGDQAFLIPARTFAPTGVLSLTESDALCKERGIADADVPRVIETLAEDLLKWRGILTEE